MPTFGPYSSVESETTLELLPSAGPRRGHLFLLAPEVVFKARVNQPVNASYPVDFIPFDGVTVGAYTDIEFGQRVAIGSADGLDNLGYQRVRIGTTSSQIKVGRSSRGSRPGELTLENDTYITVYNLHEIWSRVPHIEVTGFDPPTATIWKDADLDFATYGVNSPPVVIMGAPFAATIDPNTEIITVAFDASDSYATAEGATITGYSWDVADGTIVEGTDTDAAITVTFPAGFRYVTLTITDSNAVTQVGRRPVLARDPENDVCVPAWQVENHSITRSGQRVSFRILSDIPRDTYPDGTLVLWWEGEPSDPADRSHMKFTGWHDADSNSMRAGRTATLKDTVIQCVDVAGRLDAIGMFSQEIKRVAEPANWGEMADPNMNRYIHYLLEWHTNVLRYADYVEATDGADYPFMILDSAGASAWDQVDSKAKALTPDHLFTCDRQGRLRVLPDPMLQPLAERTESVQAELTDADWSNIEFDYTRPPRVHWLRSHAVVASTAWVIDPVSGKETLDTVHCVAPGTAPGQGEVEQVINNKLAIDQDGLNSCEGHRYARLNARDGMVRITLVGSDDLGIEPADMTWIELTIDAANAPQRSLVPAWFTGARFLVHEVNIRYSHERTGETRTVELLCERETFGPAAVTEIPPAAAIAPDPDEWWPPGYFDNDPGTVPPPAADLFYGDIGAYILWDGAHVYRTWNLSAETPVWELVDDGITGRIWDGIYVYVGGNQVGMWLMTKDAIWWCDDIMAASPTWDDVLTIATVQATEVAPEEGLAQFITFAAYDGEPGFLCVATRPIDTLASSEIDNDEWVHSYFWHTHDYGQSWTTHDMNYYNVETSSIARGFHFTDLYAMHIFQSSNVIYCIRGVPIVGGQNQTNVFISEDGGHSWTQQYKFPSILNNRLNMAILRQYPNFEYTGYAQYGAVGVSDRPDLFKSQLNPWDNEINGTQITDNGTPDGYGGLSPLWRPNKHTFDPSHIMAWFRHNSSGNYHLLESFTNGGSWSLVYDSGLTQNNVVSHSGTRSVSRHNTPNGWPANDQIHIIIRCDNTSEFGDPVIQFTDDDFATLQDKEGNLSSLVANWTPGTANGFGLPRVGSNS